MGEGRKGKGKVGEGRGVRRPPFRVGIGPHKGLIWHCT